METGTVMIGLGSIAFVFIIYILVGIIKDERRIARFKREFLDNEYNQKKQDAYDKTIDAEAYDAALTMLADYCRCRKDWIVLFGEESLKDFHHIITVPPLTHVLVHHMFAISKYDREKAWHEEVWDNYRKLVHDYESLKNFV